MDGHFQGKGMNTRTDDSRYIGDFKDDDYDGNGVYTWYDGTQYTGKFKGGKLNGKETAKKWWHRNMPPLF